jgi:hypothetical protein
MRKMILITASFFIIAALTVIYFWRIETIKASGNGNMLSEINSAALAAQSGDQVAVQNLVNTIFEQNNLNALNSKLASSLQDRLVRAETNGQMVSEEQIVQAFNWLAEQYAAPEYAKVSQQQVRNLRLALSEVIPNLFTDKDGQGNVGINKLVGSEPSNSMLPSQAVTLMGILVRQKIYVESSQKPPAQWDAEFLAAVQSSNSSQQNTNSDNSPQFSARMQSEKTKQMQDLINYTSFSGIAQSEIANGVLDRLGVSR